MIQGAGNLLSSVQMLTLSRGLYLVSVTSAKPNRLGEVLDLILPAIHVGAAPGAPSGCIEFLSGPTGGGQWLCENRDVIVAKVVSVQAVIVFTTVRTPSMATIEVEIARLDRKVATPGAKPPPAIEAPQASSPPSLKTASGQSAVSVRVDMHIQNKGDVSYVNNFWAGALGERLAIEAFSINPLDGPTPTDLEYSAVAENGLESGWISGGDPCGSRGMGLALTGFAIRLKPSAAAAYNCEYRGSFASGKIIGPLRNGAPCRSDPNDRLEAMQIFILPRLPADIETASPALTANTPASNADSPGAERVIGPKFSVFRETAE
jgi:hypothetical protein